jgi:TatD DNase family protein
MRGRRNEPAYLVHVAEALGSLKGVDTETVKRMTTDNAAGLFSKAAS